MDVRRVLATTTAVAWSCSVGPGVAFGAVGAGAIDSATSARAVKLAGEILTIAKTNSPKIQFKLLGAFSPYYEVAVKIHSTAATRSLFLESKYELYADFPRPPGSKKGTVRLSDFSKIVASKVVQVVIDGGAQQLIFKRNSYPTFISNSPAATLDPGWYFRAGYIDSADKFTVIVADTRPHYRGQQLLTRAKLDAADAQAEELVYNAASVQPTSFLPPAFPHMLGENDREQPAII